jgi:dipeptidyl aminopeptidase/acylaminoacyl peptidase
MAIRAEGRPASGCRGSAGIGVLALGGFLALASAADEARGQGGHEPGLPARATFPGRIFLACSGAGGPLSGVVAVDPNEGTWRQVARERNFLGRVSPDGRLLAVPRLRRGDTDPGLWLYPTSDGGAQGAFRVSEKGGQPCWSPDGKEILVTVITQGGGAEVWRMAADGSREERAPIPETETVVDWSPDGRWLLTFSSRKFPDRSVALMHPDGTGGRTLLAASDPVPEHGGMLGFWPRFSPDGREVIFQHYLHEGDARPRRLKGTDLLVLDVGDGRPRRIFERQGGGYSNSVCWAPDGKAVAVVVVEGDDDPNDPTTQARTYVALVGTDGRVLRTIPLPETSSACGVIDWR